MRGPIIVGGFSVVDPTGTHSWIGSTIRELVEVALWKCGVCWVVNKQQIRHAVRESKVGLPPATATGLRKLRVLADAASGVHGTVRMRGTEGLRIEMGLVDFSSGANLTLPPVLGKWGDLHATVHRAAVKLSTEYGPARPDELGKPRGFGRTEDHRVLRALGEGYDWFLLDRPGESVTCFRKALRRDPQCLLGHLGLAHNFSGEPHSPRSARKTLDVLQRCLQLEPDLPLCHFMRGEVLTRGGRRHREAASAFAKALRMMPDSVEISRYLADCYESMGDLEKADSIYRGAAVRSPAQAFDLLYASCCMFELHSKRDKAMQVCRTATRLLRGTEARAHFFMKLGWFHAESGDLRRAVRLITRATEIDEGSPGYLAVLGDVYNEYGDKERAAECYEKALGIGTGSPSLVLLNLGEVRGELGQPKAAMVALHRLARSCPRSPDDYTWMTRARDLLEQLIEH